MSLYYVLRSLADKIYDVRSTLFNLAVNINGIYLLGQYLYPKVSTISAYVGVLASMVDEAAIDFLDFRNDILDKIGDNPLLGDLLRYAEDLISIVRDPADFIRSGIRWYFPVLRDFNDNAGSTIINILTSATGLTYSFITNPGGFIASVVNSALGELIQLRNAPRLFIIEKLSQYAPDLRYFLSDPKGWLRSEFGNILPGLSDFLSDPESYIVDKVVSGFERLLTMYQSRLVKIAESIINRIF